MADEKYKLSSLALFPSQQIAHPALPSIGNISGSADFVIGSTVGNKKPSEEDCQPDKMSLLVVVSMTAEENQYNDLHAPFLSQLLTVQYLNRSALYAYELCLLSRPTSMPRLAFSQMGSLGICTSITKSSHKIFCTTFLCGIRNVTILRKTEY